MPSNYISLLREQDILEKWLKLVNTVKQEYDEIQLQEYFPNDLITKLTAWKVFEKENERIKSPPLELIIQRIVEEILFLDLNEVNSERQLKKYIEVITEFFSIMEKIFRDYDSTYKTQFGNLRIFIDKLIDQIKSKLSELENTEDTEKYFLGKFQMISQFSNQLAKESLIEIKSSYENALEKINESLDNLKVQIPAILAQGQTNNPLQILDDVLQNLSNQLLVTKDKFSSYKSRSTTGIELIKMEINKLNRSQTDFINNLDELLGSLVFSSLDEIASQTKQIVDLLFMDTKKTLESINLELKKVSELTEKESISGIENLISSVFYLNKAILKDVVEALDALNQSSKGVQQNILQNLNSMENELRKSIEQTEKKLAIGIEGIQQTEEETKTSFRDIVSLMLQTETDLIESFKTSLTDMADSSSFSVEKIKNTAHNQLDLTKDALLNFKSEIEHELEEIGITDNLINATSGILLKAFNEIQERFVLVPRESAGSLSIEENNEQIKSFKEAMLTNFSQEIIEMKKTSDQRKKQIQTDPFEKIFQQLENGKIEISTTYSDSFEKIKEKREDYVKKTNKALSDLNETKNSFETETISQITESFEDIYKSLRLLAYDFNDFHSMKLPAMFKEASRRISELENIFIEILDKATALAKKNLVKLEENQANVGLILTGEFSAMKESLLSSMEHYFNQMNERIFDSIENYRKSINRKLEEGNQSVFEKLSKQLDKPLSEFINLRDQVIASIEKIEGIRVQEIEALSFEIVTILSRIMETIKQRLSKSDMNLRVEHENISNQISVNIEALKRGIYPVLEDIFVRSEIHWNTLLSTLDADLEEIKNAGRQNEEMHLGRILETIYARILKEINTVQRNISPSQSLTLLVKASGKIIDKMQEIEKEERLTKLDLILTEILSNLVEVTGEKPDIDFDKLMERAGVDLEEKSLGEKDQSSLEQNKNDLGENEKDEDKYAEIEKEFKNQLDLL